MSEFEIHTDGSCIWLVHAGGCGETVVTEMSLPANLAELVIDAREHQCASEDEDEGVIRSDFELI